MTNNAAQDKASKLDMLDDAEKRIENRLNDALFLRLVNYQFMHQAKSLELKPKVPSPDMEDAGDKIPELPAG